MASLSNPATSKRSNCLRPELSTLHSMDTLTAWLEPGAEITARSASCQAVWRSIPRHWAPSRRACLNGSARGQSVSRLSEKPQTRSALTYSQGSSSPSTMAAETRRSLRQSPCLPLNAPLVRLGREGPLVARCSRARVCTWLTCRIRAVVSANGQERRELKYRVPQRLAGPGEEHLRPCNTPWKPAAPLAAPQKPQREPPLRLQAQFIPVRSVRRRSRIQFVPSRGGALTGTQPGAGSAPPRAAPRPPRRRSPQERAPAVSRAEGRTRSVS